MIDLTEIKKLPDEEKWKIIEEIEESMEGGSQEDEKPDADYDEKLHQLLSERLEEYRSGKSKSYTWEEVEERLKLIDQKILNANNG